MADQQLKSDIDQLEQKERRDISRRSGAVMDPGTWDVTWNIVMSHNVAMSLPAHLCPPLEAQQEYPKEEGGQEGRRRKGQWGDLATAPSWPSPSLHHYFLVFLVPSQTLRGGGHHPG